jgi:hypothetical protein
MGSLRQVLLQGVRSFKPLPNGKMISIQESKLMSGRRNLVRLAESGIAVCGMRPNGFLVVKALTVQDLVQEGDQGEANAETRIKGLPGLGVIARKQRRASQTLPCPASRFMFV